MLVYKIVQTYHFSFVRMLRERAVVIDCETFRYSKQNFIVKELAICTEEYIDCILFLPPSSFNSLPPAEQRAFNWLTKYLHGLHWEHGVYPYIYLTQILQSVKLRNPKAVYYVKGKEKSEFLANLLDCKVINLDLIGCPKFDARGNNSKIVNICENHYPSRIAGKLLNPCARRKANFFFNWLKEQANDEQPEQLQLLETTSDYESKSIEVGNTDISKFSYLNLDNNIGSSSDISD